MRVVSDAGIAAIKAHEGLRLHAYPDPGTGGSPWTIGYGHTIGVVRGQTITEDEAEEMLRDDLRWAEAAVASNIRVPLNQAQFDALVSFVFNVGAVAFAKSTLLRKLNAGDYAGAAAEFVRWDKAGDRPLPGLTKRRAAEQAMFLSDAAPTPSPAPSGPAISDPEPAAGHPEPVAVIRDSRIVATQAPTPAPTWRSRMAPFLAAALPAIIEAIPKLGKLFGSGSEVSQRNLAAVELAVGAVKDSLNVKTEQEAVQILQADPVAVQTATRAIDAIWYELSEAGGGGIEGARKADQASRAAGDLLHSASFWVAIMLLPLVYAIVGSLIGVVGTATWSDDVRAGLAGSLISAITGGLVGYYFGQTTSRNRQPAP